MGRAVARSGLALLWCHALAAAAFGLEDVDREAVALAAAPYQSASETDRPAGSAYDEWRNLRFRTDRTLWRPEKLPFEAQFFPSGGYHTRPVTFYEVVDGQPRPIRFTRGDFVLGSEPPVDDPRPIDLAGVRLSYPLNRPDYHDEVIAFLGASYFRALGKGHQYGSSARGLALDTTGGMREEFPAFVRFWLERPRPGADVATVYALLDSPRATGAYRFDVRPGDPTTVDVRARIHLRAAVATFGIAPLTSMFYGGENQPIVHDFRPEVHDADGLLVALADGEWIWRPLTRPAAPFATAFSVAALRGFGLMQRDRRFDSYQDLEAHYDRRPSIWVEPLGNWADGRVELLQLPARNEGDDNIVAFWVPSQAPMPGRPVELAWRLHWTGASAPGEPPGRVVQTRVGFGYREQPPPANQLQLHVDFAGGRLAELPTSAAVEAVVAAGDGVRVLASRVEPHPAIGGWRMTIDVERRDPRRALELRAFLRLAGDTLTETWAYALAPR
jgi:glucans biosynthesis protein